MSRGKEKAKWRIAEVLLSEPAGQRHYGYEIAQTASVRPRYLYPLLDDLMERGWVIDGWADPVGRYPRPRRFYVLTDLGRRQLLADGWQS